MSEITNAISAGLGGMFGWGFADFFAAKSMKQTKIGEIQANFFIYLVTSILLWLLIFATNEPIAAFSFSILVKLILFAFINVAAYLLFFKALHIGSLSTISSLFSCYAVGATLVSILLFSEPTSGTRIFALFLVFIGVIALSIVDVKSLKLIRGFQYAIAAALLFSLFFPFWDSFLGSQDGWLFWVAVVDSIMTLMFFVYMINKEKKWKKVKINKPLIIAGGVANAIAVFATNWGFENTSLTSVVATVSSAVPLVSAVLGYFLLKERLQRHQYIGIGAILLGTTLLFGT